MQFKRGLHAFVVIAFAYLRLLGLGFFDGFD